MKTIFSKVVSLLVAAGLLAGLWVVVSPVPTVMAAGQKTAVMDPPPPDTEASDATAEAQPKRLERAYKLLVKADKAEEKRLQRASEALPKLKEQLLKAKENGKDPQRLEKALQTFETNLGKAQAAHKTLDALLAQHPGFDADGKVTNVTQAAETIKEGRKGIAEIQKNLGPVFRWMRLVQGVKKPDAGSKTE